MRIKKSEKRREVRSYLDKALQSMLRAIAYKNIHLAKEAIEAYQIGIMVGEEDYGMKPSEIRRYDQRVKDLPWSKEFPMPKID